VVLLNRLVRRGGQQHKVLHWIPREVRVDGDVGPSMEPCSLSFFLHLLFTVPAAATSPSWLLLSSGERQQHGWSSPLVMGRTAATPQFQRSIFSLVTAMME
jgi:hypothetical protein